MKLIGMIGGVSWESTTQYYKLINELVREKSGGLSSARMLIHSMNYEEIVGFKRQNQWHLVAEKLAESAKALEASGAAFVILACNTLHQVAPSIESAIKIPFIHIADVAGEKIKEKGLQKVGLLGTQFTMEEDFYRRRLSEKFNLEVLIPEVKQRKQIDAIIYDELCVGKFLQSSREEFTEIMKSLVLQGVQGIILGCTELGMLIRPEGSTVPLFDTTILHAKKAVDQMYE